MNRFAGLMITWAGLIVLGFVLVFALGGPLPTTEERLAAARNPTPPVSEIAARQSAATIVELEYPHVARVQPTIERRTDFGIDYWLISYTDRSGSAPTGVLISIAVESGTVEVVAFP